MLCVPMQKQKSHEEHTQAYTNNAHTPTHTLTVPSHKMHAHKDTDK